MISDSKQIIFMLKLLFSLPKESDVLFLMFYDWRSQPRQKNWVKMIKKPSKCMQDPVKTDSTSCTTTHVLDFQYCVPTTF